MIKFYKGFIRSFDDLPGHTSLLIHTYGCNLKCYGCHNYEQLNAHDPQDYRNMTEVLEQVSLNKGLFDAIILSGGEFLLNDINEVISFLNGLRSVFSGKIVINTNGSFPDKIKRLIELDLADVFHIDMKLPYHLLDVRCDDYEKVLGRSIKDDLRTNFLASIHTVVKHNSPYSQVRTVKYPIVNENYFDYMEGYIAELNYKYGSKVKYQLNEFVTV